MLNESELRNTGAAVAKFLLGKSEVMPDVLKEAPKKPDENAIAGELGLELQGKYAAQELLAQGIGCQR